MKAIKGATTARAEALLDHEIPTTPPSIVTMTAASTDVTSRMDTGWPLTVVT